MRLRLGARALAGAGRLSAAVAVAGVTWGAVGPAAAIDLPFTQHVFSSSDMGCRDVAAADLDDDGDMDIMSARADDNTVAWYENNGADQPQFTEHIIGTGRRRANFVRAADFDADDDLDILSSSSTDDTIAWYENIGGSPAQFVEHIITEDPNGVNEDPQGFADGVRQVMAADLDGDNDLDVASASVDGNRVAWYESDGGSPPSFTPWVVSDLMNGPRSIELADLDGDNDIDIAAGAWHGDQLAWFENQGGSPPTFFQRSVWTYTNPPDSFGDIGQVWRIHAADMDGDLDLDLLAARRDFGIEWYENDGGSPPTFQRRVLYAGLVIANGVYASDLDNDGDLDVMSASTGDDVVAWYENLGGTPPAFAAHILTEDPDGPGGRNPLQGPADGARAVFAADLDGDGDDDILWGSKWNDALGWEENHLINQPGLCAHDLNGDNDVGVIDLLVLLGAWGTDPLGPPDYNGNGIVDVLDLLELLGQWGPCPENPTCGSPGAESCYVVHASPGCAHAGCCETVCLTRPVCCTTGWDIVCREMAVSICGNCGAPEAGGCCDANGTPGCDDLVCCRDVCVIDPFCCNVAWDGMCATQAAQTCNCP